MDVATYQTEHPAVVVAGRDTESVVAALDDGASVTVADGIGAVCDLVATQRVDCVVATASLADGTPAELVARLREEWPDLPLVFAPAAPDPRAARDVTAAPETYYLPLEVATDGELSTLVADAVATYDDRRQADRERAMFRELLVDAPFSVYFKDEQARHVAVSTQAEQTSEGGAIGKTDLELFGGVDESGEEIVPESYEDDLAVVEDGERIQGKEERVEVEGGTVLWLRTTKLPWRDEDGEIVGLFGLTRDVTEAKHREQELQREMRRMEQFASFASHDLRNPVTIAQGYVDRARETGDTEPLEAVSEELDRMDALIDDLLNVVRPDENREEEWTNLATVVERTWSAVEAPEASLTVAVPDDVEIRAASGALRQLLDNVLSNAVDHGGPTVDVEVGLTDTGFYVADDGPGIPAEDRERVFEYGFTTGGTGIGLAIAAEIAEAHSWEPSATESAAGGARLAFDRCLRRTTAGPDPTEGDAVALGTWSTIGDLAVEGGATSDGDGGWTVRGGGRALWVDIEEYGTLSAPVDGDVRIEARLTNVEQIHDYSKAGLLVADAVEPGRPLGFVGKTAGHGTEAAWRSEVGGSVETHQAEPDAALPRWYRVDRVDDRVRFYGSADGEDWRVIDENVLPVADPVAVGLAVCSHERGTLAEASFEHVRVVELHVEDESVRETTE